MYVLAAILALAVILQAAVAVIDSVLDLVKLKDLVHKIPVIGAHWSLGISMLMVWVFEAEPLGDGVPTTAPTAPGSSTTCCASRTHSARRTPGCASTDMPSVRSA